jgi:hypothetical protein
MVVAALSIGGVVGVALSGGFLYWEVGKYATPQVDVTRFDERKELAAYTVGLFAGVPYAVAYLMFALSLAEGAILGLALFLGLLLGGIEAGTWLLLRSRYWGAEPSRPFYALGFRAGVGGILALALVASYLESPSITVLGVVGVAIAAVAAVALQVAGGLLSPRQSRPTGGPGGGPVPGAVVGGVGFFLLALAPLGGPTTIVGAPLVALAGATLVYLRLRPLLAEIRMGPSPAPGAGPARPFGRTTATADGDRLPEDRLR